MVEVKHLIFLLFSAVFLQFAVCQDLFDYSEVGRDNPFTLLWNQNNVQTIQRQNTTDACVAAAVASNGVRDDREGTCLKTTQCRFKSGISIGRGNCTFWNTCCIFQKTSNEISTTRVSYFVNPQNARTSENHQLQVKLANKNVCQMRIDIISMTLEPATLDTVAMTRTCINDNFFITPDSVRYSDIPEICGSNTNQHFYVHLGRDQTNQNGITLNIKLQPDTDPTINPPIKYVNPQWNIKVTQLECPGTRRQKQLNWKRNQAAEDFALLAPRGCLQYFPERTGTIKSFGFESQANTVLNTGQDYAVCFKRIPGSCGVKLMAFMRFRYVTSGTSGPDCSSEYIFVPETTGQQCSTDSQLTFDVKTPGPLYIHFHSDVQMADSEDPALFYGFEIKFENSISCKGIVY